MATILLAIKPEFVEKIFSGEKKFEFRRNIAQRKVDKIIVYATRPISAVVGVVNVDGIVSGAPDDVWNQTKDSAGISREFFDSYFTERCTAYAYVLGNSVRYDVQKKLADFGVRVVPQGFVYMKN